MASTPSDYSSDCAALLNPALCANVNGQNGEHSPCQSSADRVCSSCKLVQYCSKNCQVMNWPLHKKICKSHLMQGKYIPAWIKEGRHPHWISDSDIQSSFGMEQYLWGNMPAIDLLNMEKNEGANGSSRDMKLLFAASGDIRNVVRSIADGLPNDYDGHCMLTINDINFMVVARNVIFLLVALSLSAEEAAVTILHVWYSALLPRSTMDRLCYNVLPMIADVCDKIKDKEPYSLQAKTFSFGTRSLRLVLRKRQWDGLQDYFTVPQELTQWKAQEIRRRCMLAPERTDYLHRALCNQPAAIRVATMTFREDGILLPHGTSRKEFDVPNPTFFHQDLVWPMKDDASPLEGWDYESYKVFAPKATNDVMGSLFYFLRDVLLRFCKRIEKVKISFRLFNVDARELPKYFEKRSSQFDRIEVSNICDRGYIGPKDILSTFGPLLASKTVNPKATLVMLFLNAVSEEYHHRGSDAQRFKESLPLVKKFISVSPATVVGMMSDGMGGMSTPEMIRMSSCYTMFGDFDKVFESFLIDVQMQELTEIYGMKIKKRFTIVEPWPLRVTEKSSKEEFEVRSATSHVGSERYMEFEKH